MIRLNLWVWATALIPNRAQVRDEIRSVLLAGGVCALVVVTALLL